MDLCTNITQGISRGCKQNAGGLYEFYIATYPQDVYVTVDTDNKITGIYNDSTEGPDDRIEFFKFVPNKKSSEFTETPTVSMENGTVGFEQKLTMIFSKMEQAKAESIYRLAYNDALVVVHDKNGNFFLVGQNDGVSLSGGNAGSGKGLTDLNGYSLEFSAEEGSFASQVDSDIIVAEALVSGASDEERIYVFGPSI